VKLTTLAGIWNLFSTYVGQSEVGEVLWINSDAAYS
jgi:hypothetical protein